MLCLNQPDDLHTWERCQPLFVYIMQFPANAVVQVLTYAPTSHSIRQQYLLTLKQHVLHACQKNFAEIVR